MKTTILLSLVVLLGLSVADAAVVEVPLACEGQYGPGQSWTTNFDLGVTFTEISNIYIDWSGSITAELREDIVSGNIYPANAMFRADLYDLDTLNFCGGAYDVQKGRATYPNPESFDLQSVFSDYAWSLLLEGNGTIRIGFCRTVSIGTEIMLEEPIGQLNSATLIFEGTVASEDSTRLVPQEYLTIQAAIDAANDGDTVIVADGTYTGDGNRDIDFGGKAITVRSENGPENCIIDCNGAEGELHRGFYFHSGEGADSVIEGFSITKGYAFDGGGIKCRRSSSPTINNCIIFSNVAARAPSSPGIPSGGSSSGGGIYCSQSSPTIINCHFIGNRAAGSGGAICSFGGSSIVRDCVIRGNRADMGGGAITVSEDNMSIRNCVITGNSAGRYHGGGGIYSRKSAPTISNCTISGNLAKFGGGIYVVDGFDGDVTITSSILWGNNAPEGPEIGLAYGGFGPASLKISYSDVQGGQEQVYIYGDCTLNWGPGNIDTDPNFADPGYWDPNGTPDDANDDFWIEGDYHLLPDSACINVGDPNYIAEPNETDLDGRPRVINGRIDMGAYEYMPSIAAVIKIVPRTINLASEGKWITSYIWLPEEYDVAEIDPKSISLNDEIKPEQLWFDEDQQIAIAKFDREEVQAILKPGEAELTIIGQLTDGTLFEATDVIRVIDKGGRK